MDDLSYEVVSVQVLTVSQTRTTGDNVTDSFTGSVTCPTYVDRAILHNVFPVVIRHYNFVINCTYKTLIFPEKVTTT